MPGVIVQKKRGAPEKPAAEKKVSSFRPKLNKKSIDWILEHMPEGKRTSFIQEAVDKEIARLEALKK